MLAHCTMAVEVDLFLRFSSYVIPMAIPPSAIHLHALTCFGIYIYSPPHLLLPFEEEDGQFDDRATFRVSNRRLPVPAFTTSKPNASAVVIQTTLLTVTLVDSAAAAASEASAGGEGLCKPILNGTCIGDNIGAATPTADTASDCCDLCASEHGCTAWTWRHPNTAGAKSCYTKYSCNRLGQ